MTTPSQEDTMTAATATDSSVNPTPPARARAREASWRKYTAPYGSFAPEVGDLVRLSSARRAVGVVVDLDDAGPDSQPVVYFHRDPVARVIALRDLEVWDAGGRPRDGAEWRPYADGEHPVHGDRVMAVGLGQGVVVGVDDDGDPLCLFPGFDRNRVVPRPVYRKTAHVFKVLPATAESATNGGRATITLPHGAMRSFMMPGSSKPKPGAALIADAVAIGRQVLKYDDLTAEAMAKVSVLCVRAALEQHDDAKRREARVRLDAFRAKRKAEGALSELAADWPGAAAIVREGAEMRAQYEADRKHPRYIGFLGDEDKPLSDTDIAELMRSDHLAGGSAETVVRRLLATIRRDRERIENRDRDWANVQAALGAEIHETNVQAAQRVRELIDRTAKVLDSHPGYLVPAALALRTKCDRQRKELKRLNEEREGLVAAHRDYVAQDEERTRRLEQAVAIQAYNRGVCDASTTALATGIGHDTVGRTVVANRILELVQPEPEVSKAT